MPFLTADCLAFHFGQSHCVKIVRIQSYSGPYFPEFGLNTDQNNSKYGHFSRSSVEMFTPTRSINIAGVSCNL